MQMIFDSEDHTYTSEYGQIFTPVTKIIAITPRAVDFRRLPNQKAVNASADRGKIIHAELEAFIKRGEKGITFTLEWFIRVLYPLFTNWESEVIVYSDEESCPYAGTIDLICYDPKSDKWLLIDLKTGGHETVDYQLSLYKRAFCIRRNIDPEKVELACIDAQDEHAINFFRVRTILKSWLDNLLLCFANDIPFVEPLPSLKGFSETQIANLMGVEQYISTIEKDLKKLKAMQSEYREQLYTAMENALVDTFECGSIKVTRVKETTSKNFDTESFKTDHADLYAEYTKEIRKKGYLKVTVRDVTKKGE